MLRLEVRINRDLHAELNIINVTDRRRAKTSLLHYYQIMNVYGKPVFSVRDNSSWDKVMIPAIETAMKAYHKQGENPERNS